MDIMQRLYESEINCSMMSLWDAGFVWKLGDHINGYVAQGSAENFGDAEKELGEAARVHFPDSDFAKGIVR